MNTVRINITLPFEVAQMLEKVKNKSAFIAEAIKERIEREEKATLVRELTQGYKARKKEDRELSLDWDTTSGDGLD
jgi:metal-responsive CopG/Arc/MetJ family transcriptional regulator